MQALTKDVTDTRRLIEEPVVCDMFVVRSNTILVQNQNKIVKSCKPKLNSNTFKKHMKRKR